MSIVSNDFDHGRIESRKIWVTQELNEYLDFPHVGQAFMVESHTIEKKSGKESRETALSITSKTAGLATDEQVLQGNRRHWTIESRHYYVGLEF